MPKIVLLSTGESMKAQWVAMRTIGGKVKLLSETVQGHEVFVHGSARMVLPRGAHHFRRLVPCPHCGREVVERLVPVRSRLDLDEPPQRLLCDGCAAVRWG
jgi:hypothetical protein